MQNIFTQIDNQEILDRIEKLNPNSERLWGKMSVSQMLEHCQKPLEVAKGSLELKRSFVGFLFGPPVIGFIAEASNLRWSFTFIAVLGFSITLLAAKTTIK